MVVAAVPARASKTDMAATVPVPVSAVWIAVLAHCAGRSARNQSGSAPGKTQARSKTDASPATTNKAINHPLCDKVFANRAPRAAKLPLAMTMANTVEKGCGGAGMPSATANTIKHAAFSNAKTTPIQKCPAVAAAIIPTPIRPKVNRGPLAKASGEDAAESTNISRTGTATPASAVVNQAVAGQVRGLVDVKKHIATSLIEAPGNVDRFCAPSKAPCNQRLRCQVRSRPTRRYLFQLGALFRPHTSPAMMRKSMSKCCTALRHRVARILVFRQYLQHSRTLRSQIMIRA